MVQRTNAQGKTAHGSRFGRAASAPPLPGPARNVDYPRIFESQLKNGLRVLVLSDSRLPRVTLRVGFPVGRVSSPQSNVALPALALELTQEGTETKDSREIAREFDQYAIQFQSEVLMEYSLLALNVLEQHLDRALRLLADTLLRPTFPEDELQKLKVRWKSSLVAERSDPAFLARERTFQTVYPGHPYNRVSIPIPDLESTERSDVVQFYQSAFTARETLLLFSGPVKPDRAVELAERNFGQWSAAPHPTNAYPAVDPLPRSLAHLVHRPGSVQTRIVLGGRIPARPDPELLRFRLANQVLGGGASSRLFLNLREDKGLTYGAYSWIRSYRHDGLFLATADVNTEKTVPAIQEMLRELGRMCTQPPTEDELHRSRAEIIGSFLRQMETSSLIGYLELHRRLNELPENYYSNFIPTIRGIGAQQVLEVSQRYFSPDRLVLTVVGDRNKIGEELHNSFGEVEVFDTNGVRLSKNDSHPTP